MLFTAAARLLPRYLALTQTACPLLCLLHVHGHASPFIQPLCIQLPSRHIAKQPDEGTGYVCRICTGACLAAVHYAACCACAHLQSSRSAAPMAASSKMTSMTTWSTSPPALLTPPLPLTSNTAMPEGLPPQQMHHLWFRWCFSTPCWCLMTPTVSPRTRQVQHSRVRRQAQQGTWGLLLASSLQADQLGFRLVAMQSSSSCNPCTLPVLSMLSARFHTQALWLLLLTIQTRLTLIG